MKQQLSFVVKGPPKPKERPRFAKHAYTPKATKDYEQAVVIAAMEALSKWRFENDSAHWNATGPYSLSVFFFMGDRRARDLDNCLKSISDGLEKSPLINNDSQIDELYAFRDYDKKYPRAVVTVRRLRDSGID